MILLNSEKGKQRFLESTSLGYLNKKIVKNFTKQVGKTTCGIVSSCVIMNSCRSNNQPWTSPLLRKVSDLSHYSSATVHSTSDRNTPVQNTSGHDNRISVQSNNSATFISEHSNRVDSVTNMQNVQQKPAEASQHGKDTKSPSPAAAAMAVSNNLKPVLSSTSTMSPEKIVAQNSFLDIFIRTKINNIIDKVEKGDLIGCHDDSEKNYASTSPGFSAGKGAGTRVGPMKGAYTGGVGGCPNSCGCAGGSRGCCQEVGSGNASCEYKGPIGIGCDLGSSFGVGGVIGFGGTGFHQHYVAIKDAKLKASEAAKAAKREAMKRAGLYIEEIDRADWDNIQLNADGEYVYMRKCNMDGCDVVDERGCCAPYPQEGTHGGCCAVMRKLNSGKYPVFTKPTAPNPASDPVSKTAPSANPPTPPPTPKTNTANNNNNNNHGDECLSSFEFTEESMLGSSITKQVIDIEKLKYDGLTLREVANLIEAFKFSVHINYANDFSVDEVRKDVEKSFGPPSSSSSSSSSGLLVNYDAKVLDPSSSFSGHHSLLAAYHPPTDSVLLMDVWPGNPHLWLPLDTLGVAMDTIDGSSNKSRGYLVVWC